MCRRGTALAKEAGPSQNDRPELEKGPTAHDCGEDQRWVPAGVIARRFHVRFGQAQTWHTLHRMGWMVQVSIRWSAEREDDVGATWIREAWPRVERRGTDQDAWLCFADVSAAGCSGRRNRHDTWWPRGRTPRGTVRAAGSGRTSLAGLVCRRSGRRTRPGSRMLVHHGRKGEKKGFRERDFAISTDGRTSPAGTSRTCFARTSD
ncbi:winged helix-turn-helix domain-containing protein [Streptomyces sp. NBC_00647]|uniref:winged helix-turn-helix domain-containing protein n=1 Tax=Streptomyces sp. NBC_00647 TaxID=2975796 RepID=UPI003246BA2F